MDFFEYSNYYDQMKLKITNSIIDNVEKATGSREIDFIDEKNGKRETGNEFALLILKPGFTKEVNPRVEESLKNRIDMANLHILSESYAIYQEGVTKIHSIGTAHKGFYETETKPYFTSAPCKMFLVFGKDAIQKVREIACGVGGTTKDVRPDGIRWQYGVWPNGEKPAYYMGDKVQPDIVRNVLHSTGHRIDSSREFTCYVTMAADYAMKKLVLENEYPNKEITPDMVFERTLKVCQKSSQKTVAKSTEKTNNK